MIASQIEQVRSTEPEIEGQGSQGGQDAQSNGAFTPAEFAARKKQAMTDAMVTAAATRDVLGQHAASAEASRIATDDVSQEVNRVAQMKIKQHKQKAQLQKEQADLLADQEEEGQEQDDTSQAPPEVSKIVDEQVRIIIPYLV